MSENKKYYWLKLKDNFFDTEEIKIIESQPNSEKYQLLYLKLCLLSLKNDGLLCFKNHIPYDFNMLSTILRVDIDTVRAGLKLFQDLSMIDVLDSGLIFMSEIESLIGKGSSEADRKVKFRERIKNQKLLEGGGRTSAKRPPEKELEIEKEIKNKRVHIFTKPTKEEVKAYVVGNNLNVDVDSFMLYYTASDWHDAKGNKIKNWKLTCVSWHNRNKAKGITNKTNGGFKDYE